MIIEKVSTISNLDFITTCLSSSQHNKVSIRGDNFASMIRYLRGATIVATGLTGFADLARNSGPLGRLLSIGHGASK